MAAFWTKAAARMVACKKPGTIVVEATPEMFVEAMNAIVDEIRTNTHSDVILLTPNFMNTREPHEGSAEELSGFCASARLQNTGVLAAYAQAVRDIASERGVACADVYTVWEEMAARGEDVDSMLSNGMNHPTPDAHAIPAELLMRIVTATDASLT